MKRVIVDHKKLNQDILTLLVEKFPNGYGDADIVTFRDPNYDLVEAVEVRTEDTIYLVKISKRLTSRMDQFDSQDDMDEEQSKKETADIENPLDLSPDLEMEDDFDES